MPEYRQKIHYQKLFNIGGWLKALTCRKGPSASRGVNWFPSHYPTSSFQSISFHFFVSVFSKENPLRHKQILTNHTCSVLRELKWKLQPISLQSKSPLPIHLEPNCCDLVKFISLSCNMGIAEHHMNTCNEPSHITMTKCSVFATRLVYRDAW